MKQHLGEVISGLTVGLLGYNGAHLLHVQIQAATSRAEKLNQHVTAKECSSLIRHLRLVQKIS